MIYIYLIIIVILLLISALIAFAQIKLKLFSRYIHPWLVKHATLLNAYRSLSAFIGFSIIIFGGFFTYIQIFELLEQPDVGLHFGRKTNTVVWVTNLSENVLDKPKYWVSLFNIDEPLESRYNPLPIPTQFGDYIRIGDRLGPNAMISIRGVKDRVKTGNRLIGWACATCPTCPKRFYWLYIKQGEGGWYAQMEDDELFKMTEILKLIKSPTSAEKAMFRLVNESRRIPIE